MVCRFVSGVPSGRTNNYPESGRGLGHVTLTIFGSTVGYHSDSLASCSLIHSNRAGSHDIKGSISHILLICNLLRHLYSHLGQGVKIPTSYNTSETASLMPVAKENASPSNRC